MPILSTILAVAGLAASGVGIGEAASASGTASQAAQTNEQIASQELAAKQQIFNQMQPFFQQYLQQGSPYLQNIQAQTAGQEAQQYGSQAGQLRQQMGQTGLGYGPSGTTAAALGQMGSVEAGQSAQNYLQNLLQNEQVKFQAAQGMNQLGQMMSGQNVVGATPQPVQNTLGSSVFGAAQALQNLINQGPTTGTNPALSGILTAGAPTNVPTTGTYNFGSLTPPTQGLVE